MNGFTNAARRDRIGLAVAGVAFVLTRLVSDYIPHPTQFQQGAVVVALALAAGAAGGLIPGVVSSEEKRPSVAVRATGAIALALFIIILFRRFIA